jgi:hypothetical protein
LAIPEFAETHGNAISLDYESRGQEFESLRARHQHQKP